MQQISVAHVAIFPVGLLVGYADMVLNSQLIGDPRLDAAARALGKYLTQFTGAPITESVIRTVQEGLDEFRTTAFLRGIDMPKLTVVALPRAGFIQVWPAQMEHKDLQRRMKLLIKQLQAEGRDCNPEELAKAIRRAYPDYSPSTNSLKFN